MKITNNISAYITRNALSNSEDALSTSIERLSSGFKVNHARDNPAGIALSRKMKDQINGLDKAGQNAADAVSIIETAEGALQEVHSMLQRMNELAVKASNGVYEDTDRESIQKEIKQLSDEIMRVAETTEFNDKTLFGGDLDLKGYSDTMGAKVSYYSDDVPTDHYEITVKGVGSNLEIGLGAGFPSTAKVEYQDNSTAIITDINGFEIRVDIDNILLRKNAAGVLTPQPLPCNVDLNLTGLGAMRVQVGTKEGQVLEVRIPTMDLKQMGMSKVDLSSETSAKESIKYINDGINYISQSRARLGAYQNRLESAIESVDIAEEKVTAAYARIMDTDMAEEMTNYTSQQVLVQAGTSILAQANERPQSVLQLLQ